MRYVAHIGASFDAGHRIDGHPECGHQHGHHYEVGISVQARFDPARRQVVGLEGLEDQLAALISEVNGRDLGEMLPGVISSPEGIATWLMERLLLFYPSISSVRVQQSAEYAVTVHREVG